MAKRITRHTSFFGSVDFSSLPSIASVMTDQSQVIEENPIGKGLDAFRESFFSICKDRGINNAPDAVARLSREGEEIQLCVMHL
jgi:hypothetical protein